MSTFILSTSSMAISSSSLFILFISFSLLLCTYSTITIPLSSSTKTTASPYQILNDLATASLIRAHHLKHPKKPVINSSTTNTITASSLATAPLSSHGYGGYSISLSFGTPPQKTDFVFDTGSSLVWFPCTSRYLCSNCNFPNIDPNQIPAFIPKSSSTSRLIGCKNPKCAWIFGPDVESQCQDCGSNCTKVCPTYVIQYGLGSTAGILLSEKLDFSDKSVSDFLVGCSIISNRQPAGIAGFGRGLDSLPSQMNLKKFSYCLVSRNFDDSPVSSDLLLDTESVGSKKTNGVSYTPFLKNPVVSNAAFLEYYYVSLRKIMVGDTHVKIPYGFLVPGSNGNGGTIVDSGSTFTFMEKPVYDAVANEFIKQMSEFSRAVEVEKQIGIGPCFDIKGKQNSSTFPELNFEFKGGAKMKLPFENYFAFVDDSGDVICLTIVSSDGGGGGGGGGGGSGPAIIFGNFQQQNYLLEFDLANNRFGFVRKTCN